jgi:hypothetical protein
VLAARTAFLNGRETIEGAVIVLPRSACLAKLTHALGAA